MHSPTHTILPHELQALRFLSFGPDRITLIDDENTFSTAVVFIDLQKRGLVHIDHADGLLITINAAGLAVLQAHYDKEVGLQEVEAA